VQVEPIKPMLKAPRTKRLKLSNVEPPPNFSFEINVRRYTEAAKNKFTELHHSFEAARSAETQAGAYTRPLLSST